MIVFASPKSICMCYFIKIYKIGRKLVELNKENQGSQNPETLDFTESR